ncbi:unnamed protein product [Sphagnum compactum]
MSGPLDTQDDAADQVPASICRVHCGFCNVMLAVCRIIILKIDIDSSCVTLKSESGRVHVPSSLIALPSVTVRCGQCTALLSVDMHSVPEYPSLMVLRGTSVL